MQEGCVCLSCCTLLRPPKIDAVIEAVEGYTLGLILSLGGLVFTFVRHGPHQLEIVLRNKSSSRNTPLFRFLHPPRVWLEAKPVVCNWRRAGV
jgi:hypothetical protein